MAVTFLTTEDKAELEAKILENGSHQLTDDDISKIVSAVIAEIPIAEGSGF